MAIERQITTFSGWPALGTMFASGGGIGWLYYWAIDGGVNPRPAWITAAALLTLLWLVMAAGFFTLQPNVSAVLLLFGKYVGTCRQEGFRWANPFLTKQKISLRARNLNGERLKVNDLRGNPIEIAVVVVWRVANTAQACFDVEDYKEYVKVQSESAVRHLATQYPYDTIEGDETSLRGSLDEVSLALKHELGERLATAGVLVDEARISHLAYASEIAGAMLRRQQAEAIIAARSKIVHGAVTMVEMALKGLSERDIVQLDDERRAAMVSNLLVVLCSENDTTPVINTGTLYQ